MRSPPETGCCSGSIACCRGEREPAPAGRLDAASGRNHQGGSSQGRGTSCIRRCRSSSSRPPRASATALPQGRPIRPLDPPHTEENYLLREMGYRIARRHAAKLRRIAMVVGFFVPLILLALAWLLRGAAASAVLALVAAVAATAGVVVERWLFFAEATHTVALYYRGEASSSVR